MTNDVLNTMLLALAFLALFAIAEALYRLFRWKAELTRKIVHVITGLLALSFPGLIGNHWLVLLLCGSFLVLLLISMVYKALPSINAVERTTRGSLLYPVIVYGCFLIMSFTGQQVYYFLPILVLALADPVAQLVGKKIPAGEYHVFGHSKTATGSISFFLIAFVVSVNTIYYLESFTMNRILWSATGISFLAMICEAISHKGYDNLTIPLAVIAGIYFFYVIV